MNLLFADTETTGTEEEDRLCQLCFHLNGLEVNQLYKPPLPIKLGAMSVHHITNKMVEDKIPFVYSPEKVILTGLQTSVPLVAHNAKFDTAMLLKEGIEFNTVICTLKISRHLDLDGAMESHKLQYLRYFYDLDIEATAHDAMGDVHVLRAVFEKLKAQLMAAEHLNEDQAFIRMQDISRVPSVIKRFTFGKYKDLLVAQVAKIDIGYLKWWQSEKLKDPQNEEDWLYTLSLYL